MTEAPPSFLHLDSCDDLPPVWADHDRLEQVFVNLLENSVRHAVGATGAEIAATLDDGGQTLYVRVSDDGKGIPDDFVDRVFLPRERGVTDGPGAGLGLAIARGIVEAHGGTIVLERVPVGTSILVALPVEPTSEELTEGGRW